MHQHLNTLIPISKTREAVIAKLGGPFDYSDFLEELRQIVAEKE